MIFICLINYLQTLCLFNYLQTKLPKTLQKNKNCLFMIQHKKRYKNVLYSNYHLFQFESLPGIPDVGPSWDLFVGSIKSSSNGELNAGLGMKGL